MSLWLQAATEALHSGDYARFREHILPRAPFAVPGCLVRELEFAERRCRDNPRDRLFPIRFLWLMEGNEQRRWGLVPLGRSRYHPEKLLTVWERANTEPQYRAERESEGTRFDLVEGAIELTAGWVYIGDRFVEDFLEVEATVGCELLFPSSPSGERSGAFRSRKDSPPAGGEAATGTGPYRQP